jgi:murein DD-endopeptidase MepM/ murein hydrolase activator NlpD
MRRWLHGLFVLVLGTAPMNVARSPASAAVGTWGWPVAGAVIRGFDAPEDPFGSGHRGIDISAAAATEVAAVDAGTVTFAGSIGGERFVTVDHGAGLVSSYSWLSALLVERDDVVARGQVIGWSGGGHPGSTGPPHLHLGARSDGRYVDPLDYMSPLGVSGLIRLAPLGAT